MKKVLNLCLIVSLIFIFSGSIAYGNNNSNETWGLWYFLLMAYIGGLILNLMPCVLPVISLKVFGLINSAGEKKGKIFRAGLVFTGGVLFSLSLMAGAVALLKSLGQSVGWGFQFQSPYFVLALITVVYIFALSLFDLFEILPPGADKLDKLAQKGGLLGSFFEGILAVLLATPCSAPFLGTALGFAFSQPGWIVFSIFLVIGLGLSTPYLLFTANPSWMKYLPKPGNWMLKLRTFMGFLLMGTVCWLLWVMGKQQGAEAVVSTVTFLLFTAISIWILGFIRYNTKKTVKWVLRFIAFTVIIAGFWTCYMWLYPWKQFSSSPSGETKINSTVQEINGVKWYSYTPEAFKTARKSGKIIFLDLSADWCLTCKTNENTVLYTDTVSKILASSDIIAFKGDITKPNKDIKILMDELGKAAVPVYAIYPPGEDTKPVLLPEVITIDMVIKEIGKVK